MHARISTDIHTDIRTKHTQTEMETRAETETQAKATGSEDRDAGAAPAPVPQFLAGDIILFAGQGDLYGDGSS